MTTSPDELKSKIAQIAGRYLDRVTKEQGQLRELVAKASSENMDAVREIEAITHRMHGSGAMLHFEEISSHAGKLERIAADAVDSGVVDQASMLPILEQLQAAIKKACANRAQ